MIKEADERNLCEDVYVTLVDAFSITNVRAKKEVPNPKRKNCGFLSALRKYFVYWTEVDTQREDRRYISDDWEVLVMLKRIVHRSAVEPNMQVVDEKPRCRQPERSVIEGTIDLFWDDAQRFVCLERVCRMNKFSEVREFSTATQREQYRCNYLRRSAEVSKRKHSTRRAAYEMFREIVSILDGACKNWSIHAH